MSELLPNLKARYFSANGLPLAGGFLYSYIATTTTPAATYTDSTLFTPNTNPVILDANGAANVWLANGSFKFILTDDQGVVQFTTDNVLIGNADAQSDWLNHPVVDGQAASDIAGETVNFAVNSSAIYDFEIIRGTTIFANGTVVIQNLNGVARVVQGTWLANEDHGVTWSVTQVGLVAQLRAALTSGPGNGTIKLSKRKIPV